MAYYRPVLVSERETTHIYPNGQVDGAEWEDCGPCSILMCVDARTGGAKPANHTHAEAEQLRYAAGYGPRGGTNIQTLASAAVVRYKIAIPLYRTGFDAIWSALKPGTCAALAGSLAAFGPADRLSRWAPNSDAPHIVYVARESILDRVVWIDPLAPTGAYTGDIVSKADVKRFTSKGIAAAVLWNIAKV